ncbi:hypothetical protein BU25DRAFT_411564 [Macroventuria anomochaeta]|uniref:Uncharacterized protein n=1 Tax=Macroventuria anomochaeta TaxID=301207 RepID=A0ACB6RX15_9PLEO|nr:uncharacterized protein BU25DRAFT_411564 [Macroventuria anomochaeta]KAF2626586.1 hypothetical protein BU25DRAFT_411564 [Macroventuria anomochaeta]
MLNRYYSRHKPTNKEHRCSNDVTTSYDVANRAMFASRPYFVTAATATNTGRSTTIGLALRVPKVSSDSLPANG